MKKKGIFYYMFYEKGRLITSLFLSLMLSILSTIPPLFIRRIVDNLDGGFLFIANMSILLLISYLLILCVNCIKSLVENKMSSNVLNKINLDTYDALFHSKYNFIMSQSVDDLYQQCTEDAQAINAFSLTTFPTFIQGVITAITAIIAMSTIYWPLVPLSILVYSFNLIPVHLLGKRHIDIETKFRNAGDALWKSFNSVLQRVRLIKIRGTEQQEIENFSEKGDVWARYNYASSIWYNTLKFIPRFLDALVPGLVFLIGGYALFRNQITIGNIIAATMLLPSLNAPIRFYSTTVLALRTAMVKLKRVFNLMDACNENEEVHTGLKIDHIDSIEFDRVTLVINGKTIIREMSFKITGGTTIGITGETGHGKSTVLLLILGLLAPTSGKILINDIDVNRINMSAFRKSVCTLLQQPFLINDTIRNNLNLLTECNWENVEFNSQFLGFDKIVEQYDDGWESMIGEKGANLSGGQRQLLAFIRAISSEPQVLLCDEMTSAMDAELCKKVFDVLYNKMKDKTVIIITHQIHLLTHADLILVVKQGSVVQTGNHESLVKIEGEYKRLWNNYQKQEIK